MATPSLEYQVVKPAADGVDPLTVRIELAGEGDRVEVAARCAAVIRDALGIETNIELLDRDTLPRSGYKATRLVDE